MTAIIASAGAGVFGFLVGGLSALRQFPRLLAKMSLAQREQLYVKADAIRSRT